MNNKLTAKGLNSIFFVITFFIMVFSSCKRQKNITKASNDSTLIIIDKNSKIIDSTNKVGNDTLSILKTPNEAFGEDIKVNEIDFNYFNSTSKLRFKTKDQNQNAQINFRIKKDSIIWFSISGFGIEAVRGIITVDSLFAIDKLNKEYFKYDFKGLSKSFNFDLNFDILQSLVLGNLPIKKRGKNKFIKKDNDYYLLRQQEGKVMIDNFVGDKNRKLKKLELTNNDKTNNKLTMTFNDFQSINEFVFPYESLITLDYQSEVDKQFYETLIEIKHKKVEFPSVPLSFPFNIPLNYSKKK